MQVLGDINISGLEMTGYSWIQKLREIGDELHDIATSSETEFLSIGEKLQEFYIYADAISKKSSSAAGLMVGKDIEKSIDSFKTMLDQMTIHINQIEEESASCAKTLQYLERLLAGFDKILEGFRKIVNFLHMLGVSIRIESAHLVGNDAGFRNLAGDIKKLAKLIFSKADNIEQQSLFMFNLIARTNANLDEMRTTQHSQMGVILRNAGDGLESLTLLHSNSSAAAKNISSKSGKITDNIGEVVMSMQFHDITRQQIEHVKESLDELCEKLLEATKGNSDYSVEEWEDLISLVGNVCDLQVAQIKHSRKELNGAVRNITKNLSGIATNVSDMSKEISKTAGNTNEAGSSFLARINNEVSSIIQLLKANAEANRELSATMISVAERVGNLSVFVNDIDEISSEIELIALNARIKAARPGIRGETLGVLAEALQKLSLEAHSRTIIFSDSLTDLVKIAHELSDNFNKKMLKRDTEVMKVLNNLEGLLKILQQVNERIFSLLSVIDNTGQKLSDEVEECVSSITVHEQMEEILNKSIDGLEVVVQKSFSLVPKAKTSKEVLKTLADRYTMGSEREVHQSLATPGAMKAKDDYGDVDLFGDDDGDNIELFGGDDGIDLFGDDDGIELFGDEPAADDDVDVEIFDDLDAPDDDEDLGDNIELF